MTDDELLALCKQAERMMGQPPTISEGVEALILRAQAAEAETRRGLDALNEALAPIVAEVHALKTAKDAAEARITELEQQRDRIVKWCRSVADELDRMAASPDECAEDRRDAESEANAYRKIADDIEAGRL